MKKFAAVALTALALTLTACQPATLTRTAESVPVQALTAAVQPAISVPATAQAPALESPTVATVPAPEVTAQPVESPAQPVQVAQPVQPVQVAQPVATPAPCEEDEPCWDCKTMGNHICGPVALPAQPSNQSTANTVPAHKEDVPLGGAWAGMTLHYAQPAQPHKGYTTPVTDSNPLPAPHAEPNPTAPRICVNTLTLTDPKPANEC